MRLVAPLDESTRSILPQFQTSDGVRANENTSYLAEREPPRLGSHWARSGRGIRGWPA